MGKATGFLEYPREVPARRPPAERIHDWFEIYQPFPEEKIRAQGARCMDCGVPFCHTGCPLTNIIPDWNDLVYRGRWQDAIRVLHATNNFPEFTGRICPAPCEAACVLGINEPPVTIKQIEKTIVDRAFDEGWIRPEPPETLTGKRVAIVGSGPAGLAAAQQLRRAGHAVTVFEKNDKIGGLLRYGIPNFKLEKQYVDRRLDQMRAEGVEFVPNAHIGHDVPVADLRRDYDAILLSGGAEHPRDLPVPGRELHGIHFAMEFLGRASTVTAAGKRVVIIGGGDTGADCLGTSHRQKAVSVHQFELLAKPPLERASSTPWPLWPMQLRTESSHEEGGIREWRVSTTAFTGDGHGNLKQLHATRLDTNEAFTMDADLVLLAMGFLGPVKAGLLDTLGVKLDQRGNVQTDGYMTGIPGIFAAGDMRRGQSLVVWAIAEGRQAAAAIDRYLMGRRL
ncbi:MAG TPA: glutamate synthase subunit beta [Bryobacteraceae bacterium]|nr:glutamate synthase subunit beta [Bryobacteraceae bacterium]